MKITSLLAYAEVLENLNERQIQVLKAIDKIEPCNNLMISKYSGLPINSVTPRTNELNKKGLIREFKKGICPITKRTTIFYERIRK
jgi:DNA-binding MarR family transcriptional regulator